MTIRPGNAEDIASVLPLVAKTVAFHEHLDPARFGAIPDAYLRYDGWMRRSAESETGAFFVAEEDGNIVGFLLGQVQDEVGIYRTGKYGMLHDLWVEPEQRRKGIGQGLVLAALERFRQAGVQQVRLDSAAQNKPAQALFAACGFRPSVTEMLTEV